MIKNKKAWIRVVEATMGVMLVASVLFVMIARAPKNAENNIYETQHFILEQVSKNDSLRAIIISYDTTIIPPTPPPEIVTFVQGMLPSYLEPRVRICEVEDVCGMYDYPAGTDRKDIYADEILITSTLDDYSPKKVRLFVWER